GLSYFSDLTVAIKILIFNFFCIFLNNQSVHYNATGTKITAFLFSSFWHHVHLDALDSRREIAVAMEKVAFWSCYSNCVLLGAKFSYLGLPSRAKTGIFFAFQPLIDRYAAPSSLALWAHGLRPLVWIFHITFWPT
ncbi:hypothetical protein OFC47_25440, partial [Escherichia coli]|nr:hypothetical protein [Escherichia coli]